MPTNMIKKFLNLNMLKGVFLQIILINEINVFVMFILIVYLYSKHGKSHANMVYMSQK